MAVRCCLGVDPDELRRLIRWKIITGVLPGQPSKTTWAAIGNGRPCAACEKPIKPDQTEMELELPSSRPSVRLHRECFTIWAEECGHT